MLWRLSGLPISIQQKRELLLNLSANHSAEPSTHIWVPEGSVEGEARAETRQWFHIGGGWEGSSALGEHGEGQRLEVLGVEVPFFTLHRLEQVLTGDNLRTQSAYMLNSDLFHYCLHIVSAIIGVYLRPQEIKSHSGSQPFWLQDPPFFTTIFAQHS